MYIENSDLYWVQSFTEGIYSYYIVHEKGVGVIDKIQNRAFNTAIKLGIITYDQYRDNQKL